MLSKCYLLLLFYNDFSPRYREDLRPLAMVTSFILENNPKSNPPPSIPNLDQLPPRKAQGRSLLLDKEKMSAVLRQPYYWMKREAWTVPKVCYL